VVDAVVEDGSVRITVADRGVGIAPERLASVFLGPGPTGQVATPSGTGLGLYLSKRLVEAHGGSISVESEPNRGTTFTVLVPGVPA
jgi:signal transduction histidine kinase